MVELWEEGSAIAQARVDVLEGEEKRSLIVELASEVAVFAEVVYEADTVARAGAHAYCSEVKADFGPEAEYGSTGSGADVRSPEGGRSGQDPGKCGHGGRDA